MHINTFLFQRSITSLQKSRRSVYSPSPHMRQKSSPVCEILHANSVLGLYESSDSKTQVLIVQELFHDPVESSVWRQTHTQWHTGHRMTIGLLWHLDGTASGLPGQELGERMVVVVMRCYFLLLIYRSVQVGVYWGVFVARRPLEAALAPWAPSWACWIRWHSLRFWARTSALMIFSTTRVGNQPRSPSCNLSPKIQPEGERDDMPRTFREKKNRKTCHKNSQTEQRKGNNIARETSSCKWQQMMQKWKTKTWSCLKQRSLMRLHGLL